MTDAAAGQNPSRRPPPTITPDEVDAWLADSVNKTVTAHRTTAAAARTILEQGIRIAAGDPLAAWGQGFYSSSRPDRQYGDTELRVATRLRRPLEVTDPVRAAEFLDNLLRRAGMEDIRAALVGAGYDGVVVHYGPGDFWVIAYYDDQVRVVQER